MPSKDKDKISAYQRSYYKQNTERQKEHTKRRREEIAKWLKELKSTLSCERCGENHPATLDFHHRDPSLKIIAVERLHKSGWKQSRLEEEISKCEVLCSNCHRKHHWKE